MRSFLSFGIHRGRPWSLLLSDKQHGSRFTSSIRHLFGPTDMLKSSGKRFLYTELAELPIPVSASFQSPDVIRVAFSKKDHDRDIKRSISKTIFVTSSNAVSSTLVQNASDIRASAVSPSRSRVVILRQTPDKKERFIEIWADDKLEASQEVSSIHGAFYTDDALASLSFSPSEHALLYTAEAHDPATNDTNKDNDSYERFRYTPQLGEGLSGKKRPTLYLFRWGASTDGETNNKLTALSFPPSHGHILLGQAVFASEDHILATGFEYTQSGRLLGIMGCFNRPACIWMLGVPQINTANASSATEEFAYVSRLTPTDRSSGFPRVLSGESTVFWTSSEVGGAHASCMSLHSLNLLSMEKKTILDTVWEPAEDGFPGLYAHYSPLPSQPFLRLGSVSFIATHSIWGSRSTVLLIAAGGGRVINLTPDEDEKLYSWRVLGTDGQKQVICTRSSPSVPHEVVLGRIDDAGGVSWQILSRPTLTPEVKRKLGTLQASIIPIPNRHPVETILLRTDTPDSSSTCRPCVCNLHGGPHAATDTSFSPTFAALALEGYSVSLVNYTGSLGFGETYVRKLLGKCGTLDVQDCIASVNHLIDIGVSESGPGKQFVQGGSHGGFLAAHLIGQYPGVFSAAAIRNPIISCGEISTTDIPDWYFGEFGLACDSRTIMTPSIYAVLFAASPISHVDNVCAKVLLLLGEEDLRAAPTNSLTYYHALKGRGKAVEMLAFPKDSHPLDGVQTSRISWEASRNLFEAARNLPVF